MAETTYTTNNVDKLVDNTSNLVTVGFINEGNTYPYTIPVENADIGISIINLSGANLLSVLVILADTTNFTIEVPSGNGYTGRFGSPIVSLDISGTTPDFSIELMRREE